MKRLAILLILAGCSSPQAASEPEPPRSAEEKLEKEFLENYTADEQFKIAQSGQYYRLALAFFNRGDFDNAKENVQSAIRLWPENLQARKLLAEVNEILIDGSESYGAAENEVKLARIAAEQAKLEITNHIRDGDRYFNAKMYDDAVREYERALYKSTSEIPGLRTKLRNAKAGRR